MQQALSSLIQVLVSEEIGRTVAQALESGSTIACSATASQVSRTYPNSGLTQREIADEVMIAAAKAGVAVEFGDFVSMPQRGRPNRTAPWAS